jgi:hypothetical protein
MVSLQAYMFGRSGQRINYLSLAIEARRAIKGLKAFASTRETTPELKSALNAVIGSINALKAPQELYSKLHEKGSYDYFEHLQTLKEVADALNDKHLAERLEAILASHYQEDDIQSAIRFFSAMEKRALHHYNDPLLAEAG